MSRLTLLQREGQLYETSFTVRWMFGGLISIFSNGGEGSKLKVGQKSGTKLCLLHV